MSEDTPALSALDAETIITLENGGDPGTEALDRMADAGRVVVPATVYDEIRAGPADEEAMSTRADGEDRFVEGATLGTDGLDAASNEAVEEGQIAVVDAVELDALSGPLREEVEETFDVRVSDGTVDIRHADEVGEDEDEEEAVESDAESEGESDDLLPDASEFFDFDEAEPLRLENRLDASQMTKAELALGPGESGGLLVADAADGTFHSNDVNARRSANLDEYESEMTGVGFEADRLGMYVTGASTEPELDDLVGALYDPRDDYGGELPNGGRFDLGPDPDFAEYVAELPRDVVEGVTEGRVGDTGLLAEAVGLSSDDPDPATLGPTVADGQVTVVADGGADLSEPESRFEDGTARAEAELVRREGEAEAVERGQDPGWSV